MIYWATVVVGVIAVALRPLPWEWASYTRESLESVAAYLAPIAGITAATNIAPHVAQRVRHWRRRLGGWRARRDEARRV